ncbi:hypothetical protein AKJ65_07070 [candidate division MSBL1 archaeon SCGC-AAA259E19]|uniref:Sulfatase N-terminal domain-containing protein n=1 Tax=candidate division MSBL1 archaeon SCGC-AAA259E19 TaxID=1698264 RepID=A0A133UEX8_9EURY|nr:hypothetical protein AKJ65_07070 [candidate division MSBL1 archaeon SCGC-AAA259E19]
MESQKKLIHGTNWDTLIILDACRYDYFGEIYRNYLKGDLKKVESPGTKTLFWLDSVFPAYLKDVVYISANPYVNSKTKVEGFYGSEHFEKIVDVWDAGFSRELNTVPPKEAGKAARNARMHNPGKRMIVHFMQPHDPYIALDYSSRGFNSVMELVGGGVDTERTFKNKFFDSIGSFGSKILGGKLIHKIGRFLGLNTPTRLEKIAEEFGEEVLRDAYRKNLEIVLEEVKTLAERLPGSIIVTADHGELLGENGLYGHLFHHHLLKEVPWLEVEGVKG